MTAVSDLLLAATQTDHDVAEPAARAVIANAFPDTSWGIDIATNVFSADGKTGLFRNEISGGFRQWLGEYGIGEDAYADGIPQLQYNSVDVWSKSVFARYKANEGWRIKVLGFPALSLAAIGICGNYQGSQSQKTIAAASALIRGAALRVMRDNADALEAAQLYPSATNEHWDGRALFPAQGDAVGTHDIADYPGGAELRMARNTTVKKELASFFFVRGIAPEHSDPPWDELRTLARGLLDGAL